MANAAAATSCDDSGFYIQSNLTGKKATIYDCHFAGKLPECVTYQGGIASDATAEVQLLFQNALNQKKPTCLSEVAAAKAHAAQIAARRREARQAARARAFAAALAQSANEPWHKGYTTIYTGLGQFELPNIYWRWDTTTNCSQYETECWHVQVVTRNGCPTYLGVQANVYKNGSVVDNLIGNNGNGVPPETPVIVELDDPNITSFDSSLEANDVTVQCN